MSFSLACGEENGGITGIDDGDLHISDDPINFAETVIGETDEATLTLRNDGDSDIRIFDVEIGEDPAREGSAQAFSFVETPDSEVILNPEDSLDIDLEYTPEASEPYNGLLSFGTNLGDAQRFDIELNATQSQPNMITTDTVSIDRVPTGTTRGAVFEISNFGTADLELNDISLAGSDDFSLSYPTPVDEIDEDDLNTTQEQEAYDLITDDDEYGRSPLDSNEAPTSVAPEEKTWVRVSYTAPDENFRSAEIIIDSNDPDAQPNHQIAVTANSEAACLELVGSQVDFGLAALGQTTQETFTINNCSSSTETVITGMQIGDIVDDEFDSDADIRFDIDVTSLPEELQDENNLALEPDESFNFRMTYAPVEEQIDEAILRLESTDDASPLHVDVFGEGVDAQCPIAHAEAGIEGAGSMSDTQVLGIPLDVIEFDGSGSSDPDGTQLTYEWAITDRPPNSMAQLENADTATPTLTTDIAGRFIIELTVYDGIGIGSCEPAELIVDIQPESAIHVELTWDVPAADDGTGTDLDLHYLHPNGQWSEAPWGVYYANPTPDWEDGSDVHLDIDSLDGNEPENVNHDDPDPNFDYSVGVYYFGDPLSYNATDARVRIYLNNALMFEEEQRFENAGTDTVGEGDFWHVADILVQGDVLDLNEIDNFQEDSGFPN